MSCTSTFKKTNYPIRLIRHEGSGLCKFMKTPGCCEIVHW